MGLLSIAAVGRALYQCDVCSITGKRWEADTLAVRFAGTVECPEYGEIEATGYSLQIRISG